MTEFGAMMLLACGPFAMRKSNVGEWEKQRSRWGTEMDWPG